MDVLKTPVRSNWPQPAGALKEVKSPARCHCTGDVKSLASPLKAFKWSGDGGLFKAEGAFRLQHSREGVHSPQRESKNVILFFPFFFSAHFSCNNMQWVRKKNCCSR